ncbi:hypothetical protein, conserved [Angomonas deanei]|uniref:TRUD domain-containing protein n=1 Tax=Angomonas deanei TaxID=59799 RepID=A0A7G2CWB5_9TRYP|nr:hypothetical protein, conserved [Angomonas deanei]
MKALPVGPLIRLASVGAKAVPTLFERDDWSAGRNLRAEETRAGILLHRSPIERTRVPALFKALSSDFQVHEVAPHGDLLQLEGAPKSKWKKVSRAKTILLENTSEPFSNPDKSFVPYLQSHGEYVKRMGKLPQGKPLLQFTLFRDHHSVQDVLNRLRYEANVPPDAVVLHPTPGGSFGCVTQHGVCIGVTKEQLTHASRHYNLHPLLFQPNRYHEEDAFPDLSRPPSFYQYDVLLRFVDGEKDAVYRRLGELKRSGFVNYFGLSHFGCGSSTLYDVAALHHKGMFDRAVGAYLSTVAEGDPFHFNHFNRYVNADTSTTLGVLTKWRDYCVNSKCDPRLTSVIEAVRQYHAGGMAMKEVSLSVPLHDASQKSSAEFLWNLMASQRLVLSREDRALKGDLVLTEGRVKVLEEECGRFCLADVVLPVPYLGTTPQFPELPQVNQGRFVATAERYGVDFLLSSSSAGSPPVYRRLVDRPRGLRGQLFADDSSTAVLKTDPFLLQERSPAASRLRYPCVYNVSERHMEKMNFIRQRKVGRQSLMLSFVLDSSCSPLSALREVFSLDFLHFTDLSTF